MQYVITKGKSVDEAIQSGLTILASTKNNVTIEVMKHRENRLIFPKNAVVKLTMKANEIKEDRSISDFVEDLLNVRELQSFSNNRPTGDTEGKAWIKDGKVYCGVTHQIHPILIVPQNHTALINGKDTTQKTLILSDDEQYELKSDSVVKETEWNITMDPDKLEVRLEVDPGYQLGYALMDSEPTQHLEPTVIENKIIQSTLQLQEIIEQMGLLGVKTGFNHAEMIGATQSTEKETFIIATGKPPVKGANGWFESMVKTKIEKGLKENENGRVDFREIKSIPIVEQGVLIGIIHPPTTGQIGYTVTNEPIAGSQTFPLKVQAGKGIVIIGEKMIATESGRPQIEQRGLLLKAAIIQKLTHTGNVDLTSGNIKFKGDVEVFGEVTDHMLVEAAGDVVIHRAINNATIATTRSVTLHGNCNGSTITAAEKTFFIKDLIGPLNRIIATTEQVISLLASIINSPVFKSGPYNNTNIQSLTRALLHKKYPDFPNEVKGFINSIKNVDDDVLNEEWKLIGRSMGNSFLSLVVDVDYIRSLQQLLADMKNLVNNSAETVSTETFINVLNVMNSNIYCNGDVFVSDKGCINSRIQSGGHVHISGVVRGGHISAEKGITIGEAGSINFSLTQLECAGDRYIHIGKAMEGVVIKIGKYKHQFTETVYNVKAFIDQKGDIVVEYSRNII